MSGGLGPADTLDLAKGRQQTSLPKLSSSQSLSPREHLALANRAHGVSQRTEAAGSAVNVYQHAF